MKSYTIFKADDTHKRDIEQLFVDSFHPSSADHKPQTKLALSHDPEVLYGTFSVDDQYVLAVQEGYNAPVFLDSCVELFLEVPGVKGYFNFEFSANGTYRIFHIIDPTRVGYEFQEYYPVEFAIGQTIEVVSSLPEKVYPQVDTPLSWELSFRIPLSFFKYFNDDATFQGSWRGNAFKCAGESSHPHWASWVSIGDELNFHKPDCFGSFHFAN